VSGPNIILANAITNNGTLVASGAGLPLTGAVTGSGTASITNGGELQFNADFQQAVSFGDGGRLTLSSTYNGAITGFGSGDTIDLASASSKSSYFLVWAPNSSGRKLGIEDSAAGRDHA
jgi:hypothetical protein